MEGSKVVVYIRSQRHRPDELPVNGDEETSFESHVHHTFTAAQINKLKEILSTSLLIQKSTVNGVDRKFKLQYNLNELSKKWAIDVHQIRKKLMELYYEEMPNSEGSPTIKNGQSLNSRITENPQDDHSLATTGQALRTSISPTNVSEEQTNTIINGLNSLKLGNANLERTVLSVEDEYDTVPLESKGGLSHGSNGTRYLRRVSAQTLQDGGNNQHFNESSFSNSNDQDEEDEENEENEDQFDFLGAVEKSFHGASSSSSSSSSLSDDSSSNVNMNAASIYLQRSRIMKGPNKKGGSLGLRYLSSKSGTMDSNHSSATDSISNSLLEEELLKRM